MAHFTVEIIESKSHGESFNTSHSMRVMRWLAEEVRIIDRDDAKDFADRCPLSPAKLNVMRYGQAYSWTVDGIIYIVTKRQANPSKGRHALTRLTFD